MSHINSCKNSVLSLKEELYSLSSFIILLFLYSLFAPSIQAQGWHKIRMQEYILSNGRVLDSGIDFSFGDSSIGYFGGKRKLIDSLGKAYTFHVTKDAGKTWSLVNFEGIKLNDTIRGPVADFLSTPSSHSVFLQLENKIDLSEITISSSDTGKTWVMRDNPKLAFYYMSMISSDYGLLVNSGSYYLSITKDSAWSYVSAAPDSLVSSALEESLYLSQGAPLIDWSDRKHFLISVPTYDSLKTVLTTDGGDTWEYHSQWFAAFEHYGLFGQLEFLKGTPYVWMNPNSDRFTPAGFFYSTDYGRTWDVNYSYPTRIAHLCPVGPTALWVSASRNGPLGSTRQAIPDVMLYTSDNGKTWDVDSETFRGYTIRKIQFTDPNHGWVLADDGVDDYLFRFDPTVSRSVRQEKREEGLCVSYYPNPAKDHIVFETNENIIAVTVYDLLGRKISISSKAQGKFSTVDLHSLQMGSYVAQIQTKEGIKNCRFLKQ